MQRRRFLWHAFQSILFTLSGGLWFPARAREPNESKTITRIAFGSCAEQNHPQPIWNTIADAKPDMFVFIGDNIYADTEDMKEMAAKYKLLGSKPEYTKFRSQIPVFATWDDHDYGINDGGIEYPKKEESKKLMLDFFGEPQDSERRSRPGIYWSYNFGPKGQRLQLILLDLRWFRTPLNIDKEKGYLPNPDPNATMIGAKQWQWLEKELKKPAELRIIASSIQFSSPEHCWEKWANYPHEKERLLKLLDENGIKNLVFISGDMHYGELSCEKTPGGTVIYDLTSSGMNFSEPGSQYPNKNRISLYDKSANFGLIEIDWKKDKVTASLQVRDDKGKVQIQREMSIV